MTFEDVMAIICVIVFLILGILQIFRIIVYHMWKKSVFHFSDKAFFLWNLLGILRKVTLILTAVMDAFMILCIILFVVF